MKFCANCGSNLKENHEFCANCGTKTSKYHHSKDDTIVEKKQTLNNNEVETKKLILNKDFFKNNQSATKINTISMNIFKNKFFLISTSLLLIIFAGIFSFTKYLKIQNTPSKIVEKFEAALLAKKGEDLTKLIVSDNAKLEIKKETMDKFIKYLNEKPSYAEALITNLKKQADIAEKLSNHPTAVSSEKNKENNIFILKKSSNNKYKIFVKPIFIKVSVPAPNCEIFINDTLVGKSDKNDYKGEFGPYFPGSYKISSTYKDEVVSLSDEITLDSLSPLNTSEYFYEELADNILITTLLNYKFKSLNITSNEPNAKIFINGKDSGFTINNYKSSPLIPIGSKIYAVTSINGKEVKSQEIIVDEEEKYITLEFDNDSIESNLTDNNSSNSTTTGTLDSKDFIFPNSDKEKIRYSDLKNLSLDELELAKDEILARHGGTFIKKPNVQKYFDNKSWYTPDANFNGDSLSDIEKHNYEIIKADKFVKVAEKNSPTISSDYVFPKSNTEVISKDAVEKLSDWELVIAKNEIFARYGLRFSVDPLTNHFTSKSWYNPIPGLDPNMDLNDVENKNIALIVTEEEKRWPSRETDIN